MKLYIKQKVFTWNDNFDVVNEKGKKVYKCKGEEGLLGNRYEILDGKKTEAEIREKVIKLRPKYEIKTENEEFEIIKRAIGIKDGFKVKGLDWDIDGNFFNHDYKITSGRKKLAVISKKEFAKVNSYEIEIESGADPVKVVACLIAIDAILSEEEEKE